LSDDPIGDRIAEIDAEQQRLRAERAELERKHGRPGVDVVLHYWRYRNSYEEQEEFTLREAFEWIDGCDRDGQLSADGVSVNGVYFDLAQLRQMFRDEED
jgi:hypothetical protein